VGRVLDFQPPGTGGDQPAYQHRHYPESAKKSRSSVLPVRKDHLPAMFPWLASLKAGPGDVAYQHLAARLSAGAAARRSAVQPGAINARTSLAGSMYRRDGVPPLNLSYTAAVYFARTAGAIGSQKAEKWSCQAACRSCR
jgi:hypothetical protein